MSVVDLAIERYDQLVGLLPTPGLPMQVSHRLSVANPDGKLVSRTRWMRSRSFVEQYMEHLRCAFTAANETIIDVSGTGQTVSPPVSATNDFLLCAGPTNNDARGIWVGTGTAAVAMTDRTLATKIADGDGSGQLEYLATTFGSHSQSGGTAQFTFSRAFGNGSGADITVKETGVVVVSTRSVGDDMTALIIRDVLTTTRTVSDGQTLTVDYTIKISV